MLLSAADVAEPPRTGPRELAGLDVSRWQRPDALPWQQLADRFSWVVARAAYGTTPDSTFVEHVRRARDVGLDVGGYLFVRSSRQREAQLDVLLAQLDAAGVGHGDLAPVLDVERNEANGDPWPGTVADTTRWLAEQLHSRLGCEPVVYINPSDLLALGCPSWIVEGPVWVADYRKRFWPDWYYARPWLAWQWTGSGRVAGYDGPLDMNVIQEGQRWPRIRNPIAGLVEDVGRGVRAWLHEQAGRLV